MTKYTLLTILLVIPSCLTIAKSGQLSGKPGNPEPAKLIKQYPQNGALNFKEDTIKLKFNKIVNVDESKITITPRLHEIKKGRPILKCDKSGENIKLKILSKFGDNTAYTVNFNNAIRDWHDNIIDVVLNFSTGNSTNSGRISGFVRDLMTNELIKTGSVRLYKYGRNATTNCDSKEQQQAHILNDKTPEYSSNINTDGRYSIENIADGIYIVCASDDLNVSDVCDPAINKYGFIAQPVSIHGDCINNIDIANANIFGFKITKADSTPTMDYEVTFDRPIIDAACTTQINSKRLKEGIKNYHLSGKRDTISWNNKDLRILPDIDSIPVAIVTHDEFGNELKQNVNVSFSTSHKDKIDSRQTVNKKLNIEYSDKKHTIASKLMYKLSTNFDITTINNDLFNLVINEKFNVPFTNTEIHINDKRTIIIDKRCSVLSVVQQLQNNGNLIDSKETITVSLVVLDGAITYKDGSTSDKKTLPLDFVPNYGTISGKVLASNKHYTVQLLDKQNEVIDEQTDNEHFIFKDIPAGEYRLRSLVWNIKHKKWRYGNIYKMTSNDNIVFSEPINIIHNENRNDIRIQLD